MKENVSGCFFSEHSVDNFTASNAIRALVISVLKQRHMNNSGDIVGVLLLQEAQLLL